jgi:hypothetical protein
LLRAIGPFHGGALDTLRLAQAEVRLQRALGVEAIGTDDLADLLARIGSNPQSRPDG